MQSNAQSSELPKVEKSGGGLPLPFAKVKPNAEPSNVTPVLSHHLPQLPPSMMSDSKQIESDNQHLDHSSTICQENELQNSQEIVMKTLRGMNESLNDTSKIEEIDKRLNILDAMWTDGEINDKLKISLVKTVEG